MIYTVTVNPSLDYIVDVKNFSVGTVNSAFSERLCAGGKGINVSIVLKNLGVDNKALGFVAGFTGREIESSLRVQNIDTDFIHLDDGFSRINLKLRSDMETEINGRGPEIPSKFISMLYEKLDNIVEGDFLVLAGSIPATLPKTLYSEIMERLSGKNIRFVVDATKDLLTNSLSHKPFMIKPNNHELGEIFGVELSSRDDVIPYARKLQQSGAMNVLVSMAGQGAVLVAENGDVFQGDAPKCKLVNSVGAGDSMVAGFIAGYLDTHSFDEALRWGLCTGSASASLEGLAEKKDVENILSTYRL